MYSTVLVIHSLVRWLVLLAALIAVFRAYSGWMGRRSWYPADTRAGRQFTMVLDIQFLIGLVLYVGLSPLTRAAFQDFGGAMRDGTLRFFAVEHIFGMIVATALAHIGRTRAQKRMDPIAQHRTAAIFYTLSLLVMLATIPWPALAHGRPLLRW